MGLAYGVQPTYIPTAGAMPTRAPNEPPRTLGGGATSVTIDGTPVRVVMLAGAAALALAALRWGGIRFNVGVSS